MAFMSDILQMIAAQGGGGEPQGPPSIVPGIMANMQQAPSTSMMGPVLQAIAKARPQQSGPSFPLHAILAAAGQNARNMDFGFSQGGWEQRADEFHPGNTPYLDSFGQFGARTPRQGISPVEWLKAGGKGSVNVGEAFASGHGQTVADVMKWAPALGMQRYANFNAAMPVKAMDEVAKTKYRNSAGFQQPTTGDAVIDFQRANYGTTGAVPERIRGFQQQNLIGQSPEDVGSSWRTYWNESQGPGNDALIFNGIPPTRTAVMNAQADENSKNSQLGKDVFRHEIASHGITQNLDPSYAKRIIDGLGQVLGHTRDQLQHSAADLSPQDYVSKDLQVPGYLLGLGSTGRPAQDSPQMMASEAIAQGTSLAAGIHPMMFAQQMYEKENPGKDFLSAPDAVKNKYFTKGFMEFKKQALGKKISRKLPVRDLQDTLRSGKGDAWFRDLLKDWAANQTAQEVDRHHA